MRVQQTGKPQQPGVVQPQAAWSSQVKQPPIAPPIYRPQGTPNAVQQKAVVPSQIKTHPIAPPVYCPQLPPKALQKKMASGQQSHAGETPRQPVAPPVYRPQPGPRVLQKKTGVWVVTPANSGDLPVAPSNHKRSAALPVKPRMVSARIQTMSVPLSPVRQPVALDVVQPVLKGAAAGVLLGGLMAMGASATASVAAPVILTGALLGVAVEYALSRRNVNTQEGNDSQMDTGAEATAPSRRSTRVSGPPWVQRLPVVVPKWKNASMAGSPSSELNIQLGGQGEMHAKVYVGNLSRRGAGTPPITGAFRVGRHAEMAALERACEEGRQLEEIKKIEIGKEPCPRCAVILNALGLSGLVVYKRDGQKEYHSWGFPNLTKWGKTHATLLGLDNPHSDSTKELINHFKGSNWWL